MLSVAPLYLPSSVLALHELTEKADCVLPVENQVSIRAMIRIMVVKGTV